MDGLWKEREASGDFQVKSSDGKSGKFHSAILSSFLSLDFDACRQFQVSIPFESFQSLSKLVYTRIFDSLDGFHSVFLLDTSSGLFVQEEARQDSVLSILQQNLIVTTNSITPQNCLQLLLFALKNRHSAVLGMCEKFVKREAKILDEIGKMEPQDQLVVYPHCVKLLRSNAQDMRTQIEAQSEIIAKLIKQDSEKNRELNAHRSISCVFLEYKTFFNSK